MCATRNISERVQKEENIFIFMIRYIIDNFLVKVYILQQ